MAKNDLYGRIRWSSLFSKLSPYTIKKGLLYFRHYGPKEFWVRLHERFEPEEIPYEQWYPLYRPGKEELEKQKKQFEYIKDHINNMYGKEIVEVEIRDSYRNMKEAFDDKMYIIELADKAISDAGYVPVSTPVRGGTDGSQLTFMGIPTPNLGTGGLFCHGNHEMLCIDDMKAMVKIVINLLGNIVEKGL